MSEERQNNMKEEFPEEKNFKMELRIASRQQKMYFSISAIFFCVLIAFSTGAVIYSSKVTRGFDNIIIHGDANHVDSIDTLMNSKSDSLQRLK